MMIFHDLFDDGQSDARTRIFMPTMQFLKKHKNTLAELRIKQAIGKLRLPDAFDQEVISLGYDILDLKLARTRWLAELPLIHRDPFDRMLIAQAIEEGLTIVTSDQAFARYPVQTLLN